MSVDRQSYLDLVQELNRHNELYYLRDRPEISDRDYDALLKKLERWEKEHPEWVTPDSPTQHVGIAPLTGFAKVHRQEKMLSLDNSYNLADIDRFLESAAKILERPIEWSLEPKFDGASIECRFEDRVFAQASTRGDGLVGEDITLNLKTLSDLPLKLPKDAPDHMVLRGEVYMERQAFAQINAEREAQGLQTFKNPRNSAAGSLRLLDPKETRKRPLRLFLYQWANPTSDVETQSDVLQALSTWGLPVFSQKTDLASTSDDIHRICQAWDKKRHQMPFEVDGLVIKAHRFEDQAALGQTHKYPRWAIAYKFAAETATTRVRDIRIQVGRTGVLTPVADLEPVELGGTTVGHASLHNIDEIRRLDVRVGDTVDIEKAGEIIPQVLRVLKETRKGKLPPFEMPNACPVCGSPVGQAKEGDVAFRCMGGLFCQAQLKEGLRYFASRTALNIEDLGPALIEQLVDQGWVEDAADLFSLEFETLVSLERMGEKSAKKLLGSISKVKRNVEFNRLLVALGIPGVGASMAVTLARHFGSLDSLLTDASKLEVDALTNIHGVGDVLAENVRAFFLDDHNRRVLQKMKDAGLHVATVAGPKDGPLRGKAFCVTGTLSHKRNTLKDWIEEAGGAFQASVTKKTDYLLAGKNTGQSKLEKAEKLGVKILDEKAFLAMLGPTFDSN